MDGLLYDQSKLGGVKFGWFSSDRNGCGWVAVYNVLRLLGDPHPACEVRAALERGLLLGGACGAHLVQLAWYLCREGHSVAVSVLPLRFARLARDAGACVLLYWHRRGAHFVALRVEGDRLHFYNAGRGAVADLSDFPEFLRERGVVPLGVLLCVDDPQRERRRRVRMAKWFGRDVTK